MFRSNNRRRILKKSDEKKKIGNYIYNIEVNFNRCQTMTFI